mgnify:CR=1 FL=1|tara:strand:+ start:754 stop:1053 length:300 start_codon:yes stop_codon:yes gene_type:complete
MKKFFLINFIIFLTSCGIVKEGFVNNKKNGSDEFLVEKKSPLIIPPDFDKLPIPNDKENASEIKGNQIKKLLSKDQTEIKNSSTSKNFEESILEKIKKN